MSKPIRVRPDAYDWVVVNTSAGKDSQCMLDVVCKHAGHLGVLDRVVAVPAKIPEEWKGTPELARERVRHYGVRFELVEREQGGSFWPSVEAAFEHLEKMGVGGGGRRDSGVTYTGYEANKHAPRGD